ncbi:unnamed protein product, partial [Urochloa humidicola]
GRVFIAVLNPLLIPAKLDVVVGDHYFELEFEVERKGVDENGEEAEFNWVGIIEGDGEDDDQRLSLSEEERDEHREAKRLKGNSAAGENKKGLSADGEYFDGIKNMIQNMNRKEFEEFLKEQAKEILDGVVRRNLEEMADKVMAENDDDLIMKGGGDRDSEGGGEKAGDKHSENLKGMREEAAIPEAVISPTRCSPRLVHSVDEHTMTKAERRVAERNLENGKGHF